MKTTSYIKLKEGLLILFFFSLFGLANHYLHRFHEVTDSLNTNQWEISKQRSTINKMKSVINKVITEDSLATQIIFSNSTENLSLLLDLIKEEYDLQKYNFAIKESKSIELLKRSNFYDPIATEVSLYFHVESLMKLYMFIEDVIAKIPGQVHIKSISFMKNNSGSISTSITLLIYTLSLRKA